MKLHLHLGLGARVRSGSGTEPVPAVSYFELLNKFWNHIQPTGLKSWTATVPLVEYILYTNIPYFWGSSEVIRVSRASAAPFLMVNLWFLCRCSHWRRASAQCAAAASSSTSPSLCGTNTSETWCVRCAGSRTSTTPSTSTATSPLWTSRWDTTRSYQQNLRQDFLNVTWIRTKALQASLVVLLTPVMFIVLFQQFIICQICLFFYQVT